jgi:hypothetical protein
MMFEITEVRSLPKDFDPFELLGLIASGLFGIVAWRQGRKAARLQEKLAQAQPNLKIRVFDCDDIQHFVVALPLSNGRFIELPYPIEISNIGDKSATDIQMSLVSPKSLRYSGYFSPTLEGSDLARASVGAMWQTEHLYSLGMNVQVLNPGVRCQLVDRITVGADSLVESSVRERTKDGFMVEVKFAVIFAYRFDLVIVQRDQRPITQSFFLTVLDISRRSIQEAFQELNQVKAKGAQKRRACRRFSRIISLLRTRPREPNRVYVVEYGNDSLQSDPTIPVDHITEDVSARACEGLEFGVAAAALGKYTVGTLENGSLA